MIGMFTGAENRKRLSRIEKRLAILRVKTRTPAEEDEYSELRVIQDELNQYFMDLWRIEGGGVRDDS